MTRHSLPTEEVATCEKHEIRFIGVPPKKCCWICDTANENESLRTALRIAAGYISATPGFTDKHPMEVLDWLMTEAEAAQHV